MPTHLGPDEHLAAIERAGNALKDAAAQAGLDAKVPTCPAWDVTKLVLHQGMVHRWAAANLRGESDHDTKASQERGRNSDDLLGWFVEGLTELIATIKATPDDAKAMVFLNDAPPPRRFWARRQAHETTIHGVDALSALLQRWPSANDAGIEPAVAADGIDELLTGFITRGKGKLHADEPYDLEVRAEDTRHVWTVRVSDGPVVTTTERGRTDVVFSGSAAQLYLSLWNRADEISTDRPDVLELWREMVRVRWS
jgi:uncharacterized protein (TIGR03083 family)